jgi:DNA-binding SARP family transcriptional activator
VIFEAKAQGPLPCDPDAASGVFEDAASGSITLLEAADGYVLTEGLALAFAQLDRHPLWLRLGPEDRDPATFLFSLITAARSFRDDVCQVTLSLMRDRPGPVFGWPPLFTQLACDLRSCLITHGALVFEDIHQVPADCPTLSMVSRHLLPGLAGAAPCVLVAHGNPNASVPDKCERKSASELRLSEPTVRRLLEKCAPELPPRAHQRAIVLIDGRAAILAGLRELAVNARHGLEPLIERAAGGEELIARTAEILLADVGDGSRSALGLAARIEYTHPAMTSSVAGGSELPPGPWLQHLEGGWVRVRPFWRRRLHAVLGTHAMPDRDTLRQSAEWLLQAGAYERAVCLYLDIGDHDCAARAIASRASTLMDLGQWATIDRWLARLPEELLAAYPELSHGRADIAAIRRDTVAARRWFDIAASRYAKRNDVEGQCRSMLSESAVAAEAGDLAQALSRAYAASSLASAAELTAAQMWASWQIGRVALVAGDSDGALASFGRAASFAAASDDVAAARPVRAAGDLARQVGDLRRRQESHREAQAALNRAECEAFSQLMEAVRNPAVHNGEVFGTDGWTRAPAPLKLPGLMQPRAPAPGTGTRPLLRLCRALLPHREASSSRKPGSNGEDDRVPCASSWNHGYAPAAEEPASGAAPTAGHRRPGPPGASAAISTHLPGALSPGAAQPSGELAVHLLGPLYVAIDDVAVEDWSSARCRSLFGYLLTHREPWPPREVLMEVFWPGSSPEASRNSLNVAIHALRRTLRTITDVPIVIHSGGSYRINCDLRLWLDVDEFDRRVESGRRFEDAAEIDRATRDYEFAGGLYRGDFLADDPYEDWAALTRERLRLAHLDALGRLSNLYFDAGHYTACAGLCQRIIGRDPCREDAHRRLMRCYSRQGQPHLALMQYRMCARALADELGVETAPATAQLYQSIRRHERV